MIAAELRIRLEGRVEALEREVSEWEAALLAARRRHFEPAARLLEQGLSTLTSRGDAGLAGLLAREASLQRAVEKVVAERLHLLGMPVLDLARGARWLDGDPVLYEHHRVTPAFLSRSVVFTGFIVGLPVLVSWFLGAPGAGLLLGLTLFALAARWEGWSHVVLTQRRLVLEGDVFDLTLAEAVVLVRPFKTCLPLRFGVEVRFSSGATQFCDLRFASEGLRAALRKRGLHTGNDWGPW
jgi:hypothetical protein